MHKMKLPIITDINSILRKDFQTYLDDQDNQEARRNVKLHFSKPSLLKYIKLRLKILLMAWNNELADNLPSQAQHSIVDQANLLLTELREQPKIVQYLYFFALTPIQVIKITRQYYNHKKNTEGLCIPVKNGINIILFEDPDEYIISHETIHAIQSITPNEDIIDIYQGLKISEMLDSIDLPNELRKYTEYLLQQHEVEPRLNEIIVSMYNKLGYIPQTYKEFSDLLLSYYPLTNSDQQFTRNLTCDSDLKHYLTIFFDANKTPLWLSLILPLAFTNLLTYYGFKNQAKNIQKRLLEEIEKGTFNL